MQRGVSKARPIASAMSRVVTPSSATACSRVPVGASSRPMVARCSASAQWTAAHRLSRRTGSIRALRGTNRPSGQPSISLGKFPPNVLHLYGERVNVPDTLIESIRRQRKSRLRRPPTQHGRTIVFRSSFARRACTIGTAALVAASLAACSSSSSAHKSTSSSGSASAPASTSSPGSTAAARCVRRYLHAVGSLPPVRRNVGLGEDHRHLWDQRRGHDQAHGI